MRIDPVYLIAPLPAPKTMLARRAFLLAGVAGVAGVAVGGAAGIWWLPRSTTNAPASDMKRERMLAWARRIAHPSTPLAELVANSGPMLMALVEFAPEDPLLWAAVGRLAEAVVADSQLPERRLLAQHLLQTISTNRAPKDLHLGDLMDQLGRIAR